MPAVRLIPALLGLGVVVVGLAAVAGEATGVPMGVLFRDASAASTELRDGGPDTYAGSFYLGAVSMFTIAVWSAVTALDLFVAWVWRAPSAALMAVLTTVMGTDDALLLHEKLGPSLGVPDLAWPALYAVVSAALLWRLLRARTLGPAAALTVGLALLALSLGIDVLDEAVLHLTDGWFIVAEDGSKLLGALAWVAVPVLLHLHHASRSRGVGPGRGGAGAARLSRGAPESGRPGGAAAAPAR